MPLNIGASISDAEKKVMLESAAEELKLNLWRTCIVAGIDPDTLSWEWTPGEDVSEEFGQQVLRELAKLKGIEDKLQAIVAS